MPVQVMVSTVEAEAIQAADITGLVGKRFSYDPAQTVSICEKINATNAEGAQRLVTRLADIYGKNFARPQVPSPAPLGKKRALKPKPQLVGETAAFSAMMDDLVTGGDSSE